MTPMANLNTGCVSILLSFIIFSLGVSQPGQAKQLGPKYFVKTIKLQGNILIDDGFIAPSIDLGRGLELDPKLFDLIKEEVEGFYASYGFFKVRVSFTTAKPLTGVLTLNIDEAQEIKEGRSDQERAQMAVNRLIQKKGLKVKEAQKKEVVAGLVAKYRNKRAVDNESKRIRIKAEKTRAEMLRKRYLIQYEKRKADEAALLKVQRKKVAAFQTQQQALREAQKRAKTQLLLKMKERILEILNSEFNGNIPHEPEVPKISPEKQQTVAEMRKRMKTLLNQEFDDIPFEENPVKSIQ